MDWPGYLCRLILFLGFVASPLVCFADDQKQPAPGTQPSQTSTPKLHVKKGSRDDINAIGKREILSKDFQRSYSLDKEIEQGKVEAKRVDANIKLLDDPDVYEYINRVGQNLVRNSDTKIPVAIKVVESDEANASSVMGGHLYVNSGLILDCQNEAELAGVMSHAIAHLAARHATRLLSNETIAGLLSKPMITVIGDPRSEELGLTLPVTMLKYRRYYEMEADYLGIQYVYKSGYDPMAFVTRMERKDTDHIQPGSISAAFSTEPLPAERIAAAKKEISRILPPNDHLIVNTPEFDSIKARLAQRKAAQ